MMKVEAISDTDLFLDIYIKDGPDHSYRVTQRKATGEWSVVRLRDFGFTSITQEQRDAVLRFGMSAAAARRLTGCQ